MNNIEAIIEIVLDEHRDASTHSNPELAQAIAKVLIHKSLQQFVELTGGSVEYDNDGQLIVYTGLKAAGL